jgi:hypothetical protein
MLNVMGNGFLGRARYNELSISVGAEQVAYDMNE